MQSARMNLKVLLPYEVFDDRANVSRIVAETREGSFGLLPNRLDCVAALVPGILVFEADGVGEICIAVDEGVLVKAGADVLVSVRNAVGGADLETLRETVDRQFLALGEQERIARSVMAKLETGFIRRLTELHHE